MDANFDVLKGKTISSIEGMEKGNDGYCHVECKATFEVIGNKFKGLKRL